MNGLESRGFRDVGKPQNSESSIDGKTYEEILRMKGGEREREVQFAQNINRR